MNNVNDFFFHIKKTNNKYGKQTNKVNNNKLKEENKRKNLVTQFLVMPLRVLLTTDSDKIVSRLLDICKMKTFYLPLYVCCI